MIFILKGVFAKKSRVKDYLFPNWNSTSLHTSVGDFVYYFIGQERGKEIKSLNKVFPLKFGISFT